MIRDFLHFRISKITIYFGLFIIISASFASQVMEFIQGLIEVEVAALLRLMLIALCSVFLIFVVRKRFHIIRTPIVALVLIMGLILTRQVEYPAEKIHVLEYGVLGWLAARDLIKVGIKKRDIILATLFCLGVGILDEIFQAVLPYRVFDLRDIAINGLAGAWGAILYLLTYRHSGEDVFWIRC